MCSEAKNRAVQDRAPYGQSNFLEVRMECLPPSVCFDCCASIQPSISYLFPFGVVWGCRSLSPAVLAEMDEALVHYRGHIEDRQPFMLTFTPMDDLE